jgi:hypothetical protein
MTELTKAIKRETAATQFERGERNVIVTIEPAPNGAMIGFRLKGTRATYRVGVGSAYVIAVRNHLDKIERRTRKIMRDEKVTARTARARARKQLAVDLK